MSMMKKIEIDGKAVAFKASAAIPRIYRIKFQRDIYKDLSALEKAIGKDSGNSEDVSSLDLLTIGMVNDMFVESRNGEYKGWRQVATQEDFDRF